MIRHIPGQKPRRPMDFPSGDAYCVLGTKTASPHGYFPSGDALFVLGTHQTNSLWDAVRHKIAICQRLMCVARWTRLTRRTYLLLIRDTCPMSPHSPRSEWSRARILALLPAEPLATRQRAQPWRRAALRAGDLLGAPKLRARARWPSGRPPRPSARGPSVWRNWASISLLRPRQGRKQVASRRAIPLCERQDVPHRFRKIHEAGPTK